MVALRVMRVVTGYDEDTDEYINVDLNEGENRKNVEFCENCSENEESAVYHPREGGTLVSARHAVR